MYIYYNDKTDYLEVLEKKVKNYSVPLKNGLFKIFTEKGNKLVGYGVENVSKRLKDLDIILNKIRRVQFFYPKVKV